MQDIKVHLTLFKETPGTYHYRVPITPGQSATTYPASDVYIRKSYFNGAQPPKVVEMTVKAYRYGV